jgi:RimJ/RimL family protein N-acetyltransferase
MMFGRKKGKLKDGTEVLIRPLEADDEEALYSFFQSLPDEVLFLIRHDVRNPKIVYEWTRNIDYSQVLPLLAFVEGRIVGDATLHRVSHGWKRHIGRVRIVVSPDYQGRGLATFMLNELVRLGNELGLEKLWAEIPLDSVGAIRACRNAGFGCKAVIEGMVKDTHNKNIDVLIMICDIPAFFDHYWKQNVSD